MEGQRSPSDVDRPVYHVMGQRGWINDPNGPIYFNGLYHIFFQHLATGCEWDWGLVWGHVVSRDLVHWEHLPPAIRPTPGSLDADGCFSGCCTIDALGVPTLMYTGVRLRSNAECGALPPAECDLQLPFIESQLLAVADPKDAMLLTWRKSATPFIALPPPNVPLTGWRDPFVIQKGGNGLDWIILMGAGLKGQGGTTLIYRSKELHTGWQLDGELCAGELDLGSMWECPLLAFVPAAQPQLPQPAAAGDEWRFGRPEVVAANGSSGSNHLSGAHDGHVFAQRERIPPAVSSSSVNIVEAVTPTEEVTSTSYFYCVSPDAPTNPVLYWMGSYDHSTIKFDLSTARGPYRLDLGDTIYAPNILDDPHGRKVLWCWVQERRKVGTYDYSGCMATPRVMLQEHGRMVQQPLPELAEVRDEQFSERWSNVRLPEFALVPLRGVTGRRLDLELTFRQEDALISGVVFQSWNGGAEGSAAVLYDWDSQRLEVMYEALDPETLSFSLSAPNTRRVGGEIEHRDGDLLRLRVLLDHSLLEVFTGNGQTLTTRLYRGDLPRASTMDDRDFGVAFLSLGGDSTLVKMGAWQMNTIWKAGKLGPATKANAMPAISELVSMVEAMDVAEVEAPPRAVTIMAV